MKAINTTNLTRKFGNFTAVDKISFQVKQGELFGLLGPNGAGKTTIINMLSTLLKITSGQAQVNGFDVQTQKNKVRESIGIVFQEPALDGRLTGKENLDFHARMYGINKEERRKRIKKVLKLVKLTDKADELVDNYSGGMKRRLEISRGLIQKPKVLFLDEPTLGLDAQTRRSIWEYIKKLNQKNKVTIILTTHYMEEADFLCNRIAIIDHGKIIALDKPSNLKNFLGGDAITLELKKPSNKLKQQLEQKKWVKSIKQHNNKITLTTENGEKHIPEIIRTAEKQKIQITSVNLRKPSLEDVFLYFTGKTIRTQEAGQTEKMKRMRMRRMGHG